MLRAGRPYRIRGAGGERSLAALKAAGGNSTRTWGADNIDKILDEAHRLGMTVTVGIWLGHERHGFDYTNADQVAEQYETAKQAILRYRNHPALLMWGVGNEMEGFKEGDNAAIWSAVNNIAALAKKLDPNHPTMTVLAEIGGQRVKNIHRLCPDVDIVGVNAYGRVRSLGARYEALGGTKPYVVTETGPAGAWEVKKTAWGAPHEATSTEKAAAYAAAYTAIENDPKSLGSYMFLWDHKREATATWFGMFLPDGRKTPAVDAMTKAWSGKPPKNRAPDIIQIGIKTPPQVAPGKTVRAYVLARDWDGDKLTYRWVLEPEEKKYNTGGDRQPEPDAINGAITKNGRKEVRVRMPKTPGAYRLYAYVYDSAQSGAVATIPLFVTSELTKTAGRRGKLPFVVYDEASSASRYIPSGYMGDHANIRVDGNHQTNPYSGKTCMKVTYPSPTGWAGVAWQHPANDWGDRPGGFDLTGAQTLSFWARGSQGGEVLKFGYGLLGPDKPFGDSAKDELDDVVLSPEWKQYRVDLKDKDLRRIKTGFFWVLAGQGRPIEFYLDDIRYE